MLLLLLLLGLPLSSSSPAHINVLMRDLAPPWPSPPPVNSGINTASSPPASSSSSAIRFTALHVTMIFIAILLCVIICAIPWDNIKCAGGGNNQSQSHEHLEENAAPQDEEQQQQQLDQQQQSSGLSKAMIKSFQLVRYGSSSLREKAESDNAASGGGGGGCWAECMICLSDFRNGQMVRILPHCSHGFHKKCIEQWLHSHTSCPICRNVLVVLGSPAKTTTNTAAVVSNHHHRHAAPEAFVRHHHRQHHQQQQQEVVVDLDRVQADEDADDDVEDAASVEHDHHGVHRTYDVVISD